MAHATDYKSRPIIYWDRAKVLKAQLFQFFDKTENWTERALREHCIDVYSDMGLQPSEYDSLRSQWLNKGV